MPTVMKRETPVWNVRPNSISPAQEIVPAQSKSQIVETWIGNHPVLCLGAGLIAGALLGWFVKRK